MQQPSCPLVPPSLIYSMSQFNYCVQMKCILELGVQPLFPLVLRWMFYKSNAKQLWEQSVGKLELGTQHGRYPLCFFSSIKHHCKCSTNFNCFSPKKLKYSTIQHITVKITKHNTNRFININTKCVFQGGLFILCTAGTSGN